MRFFFIRLDCKHVCKHCLHASSLFQVKIGQEFIRGVYEKVKQVIEEFNPKTKNELNELVLVE